jgi:hypothetical protein
MTKAEQNREEVFRFGQMMQKEFPNGSWYDHARVLMQTARQLAGLNLAACNYGLTDRQERKHDRLQEKAQQIAADLGTTVVCNGDPRGYALYIVTPSGNCGGDWGSRGYPVPEV